MNVNMMSKSWEKKDLVCVRVRVRKKDINITLINIKIIKNIKDELIFLMMNYVN